MLLGLEDNYTTMVTSATKSKSPHIVNVTVEELEVDGDKDDADKVNEEITGNVQGKRSENKKVSIHKYLASSPI